LEALIVKKKNGIDLSNVEDERVKEVLKFCFESKGTVI